jgi:large subunit ribosomal protein L21
MLAVIKTGGKQYVVSPDQKLKIEKLEAEPGKEVIFDEVLLMAYSPTGSARLGEKSNKIEIGNPTVPGAKVTAKVLSEGKGKKVIVFKHKAKTRYKVKKGHRQLFTEVQITKIGTEK